MLHEVVALLRNKFPMRVEGVENSGVLMLKLGIFMGTEIS